MALFASILVVGCKDIEEENLGDDVVSILSPTNGVRSDQATQTFWWNEVEGATNYNLQVVSTSFDSIIRLWLDSNLTNNKFTYTLPPGDYEWRVRAYNGSSTTNYTTFKLYLDSATSIGSATIILLKPLNNIYNNTGILEFSWDRLNGADNYRFELVSPDWDNGEFVIGPLIMSTESYTNTGIELDDGTYSWGVRGESSAANSLYSVRDFIVDKTPPNAPKLTLPTNGASLPNAAFNLKWDRASDQGSPLSDSVYIYEDVNQTIPAIIPVGVDSTNYTDSLAPGTYYWQVRSVDEAGNSGTLSTQWTFTINP